MSLPDLKRRRLRLGWSREQLAHEVGVSAETIGDWEEGTVAVTCPRALEQVLRQRETQRDRETRHVA